MIGEAFNCGVRRGRHGGKEEHPSMSSELAKGRDRLVNVHGEDDRSCHDDDDQMRILVGLAARGVHTIKIADITWSISIASE